MDGGSRPRAPGDGLPPARRHPVPLGAGGRVHGLRHYFCSVWLPTNPNRLYMWSGCDRPGRQVRRPGHPQQERLDNPRLTWKTYPERLRPPGSPGGSTRRRTTTATTPWSGSGSSPRPAGRSPLLQNGDGSGPPAGSSTTLTHDQLPQVSWLVAPSAQSEHPNWMPAAGAQYIAAEARGASPPTPTSGRRRRSSSRTTRTTATSTTCRHRVPRRERPASSSTPPDRARLPGADDRGLAVDDGGTSAPRPSTILARPVPRARFGVAEPNISAWRRRYSETSPRRSASRPAASTTPADPNLGYRWATLGLAKAQEQVQNNPPRSHRQRRADPACH